MLGRQALLGLFAFCLFAGQAGAQTLEQTSFIFRRSLPTDNNCGTPATGPSNVSPLGPDGTPNQAPTVDAQPFAQAPAAGGEGGLSFNPAMFGDLGIRGFGKILVRTFKTTQTTITTGIPDSTFPPTTTIVIKTIEIDNTFSVPIVGAGSFKISDNESPRPTDRAFLTYNYFDRINAGPTNFGLNRELIGFEKTFLDGEASFGLRLPFLQTTMGSDTVGLINNEVGDMTLIGKFALLDDTLTGNILSAGLAVTVPSADHSIVLADGNELRSVLIQPYGGWIYNFGDFYAQGFHALVVPTDSRDVTTLDNDIGVGYSLFKNQQGFLRAVVPTIEGHLYTPLNHTNNTDLIYTPNIFTFTAGVNFVLPKNSTIGVAFAAPITGPRPNNAEALVSFNFRF